MSSKSAKSGYAFECCVLITASAIFGNKITEQSVNWIRDVGDPSFDSLPKWGQISRILAARAVLDLIQDREAWVTQEGVEVIKQRERSGSTDVRDICFKLYNGNFIREMGISLKWNNNSDRHQRISRKIDVAREWLGLETDNIYMQKIDEIFTNLRYYTENEGISMFREIDNIEKRLYIPALECLKDLFERTVDNIGSEAFTRHFLHYLIGTEDHYKAVIMRPTHKSCSVIIRVRNFNGSLSTKKNDFPTKILDVRMGTTETFSMVGRKTTGHSQNLMTNRLYLVFDNDWKVEIRLHNGKGKIENSLKCDTFVYIPNEEKFVKQIKWNIPNSFDIDRPNLFQ